MDEVKRFGLVNQKNSDPSKAIHDPATMWSHSSDLPLFFAMCDLKKLIIGLFSVLIKLNRFVNFLKFILNSRIEHGS
jgi:hypothetical protein